LIPYLRERSPIQSFWIGFDKAIAVSTGVEVQFPPSMFLQDGLRMLFSKAAIGNIIPGFFVGRFSASNTLSQNP
jgi:hypothetical protein